MSRDTNNISADAGTAGASATGGGRAPRYRYSAEAGGKGGAASAVVALDAGSGTFGGDRAPSIQLDWQRIGIALAGVGLCVLALYPSELLNLESRWYTDAGWSHGFVVPLISIFLVWVKWDTLRHMKPAGTMAGLGILLLGVVGQVLFRATGTAHMSNLSILIVLMGLVLFVFGWEYLKILWLPIGFLIFAMPPPNQLYALVTAPMQIIAAEVGVWFLPLFGCDAQRSGTVIDIVGVAKPLNVEEACSGMRMLVAFLALAVALAYSMSRPMWEKIFLAMCAIPIAIFCNALRVTFTGVLVAKVGPQWGEGNAHAYFGLLMLLPAMGMQLGIGWALDHIFIETDDKPAAAGGEGMTMESGGPVAGLDEAERKRLSKSTFARLMVASGLIVAAIVVMHGMEKLYNLTFDKPAMPLQKNLEFLNKSLGDPPRYIADGQDQSMSDDILEVLGTREYLLRRYNDTTLPAESPLAGLHLNLNYYATGSSTPHVPEICWAGAGMVEASDSRHMFDIPNVRRRDGRVVTLRMNMISFHAPGQDNSAREKRVAYMFEVNGDYVATPAEVTSRFWRASNKFAYDTKIEVTVGDDGHYCSREEAEGAIASFIRAAIPEIEECLPDPNYIPPAERKAPVAGKSQ